MLKTQLGNISSSWMLCNAHYLALNTKWWWRLSSFYLPMELTVCTCWTWWSISYVCKSWFHDSKLQHDFPKPIGAWFTQLRTNIFFRFATITKPPVTLPCKLFLCVPALPQNLRPGKYGLSKLPDNPFLAGKDKASTSKVSRWECRDDEFTFPSSILSYFLR